MNPTTTARTTRSLSTLVFRVSISILTAAVLIAPAGQALATGALFYSLETGEVRAIDMATGSDAGISIPNSAFFGAPPNPATGRNIAFDPDTDLLWYSADDNGVHSLNVGTLAPGPTISDIGDNSPFGASRTIAIDIHVGRLYISNANGNVEVYNLDSATRMFTIPLSAFGLSEPNPGNLRQLAADGYGNLWYAAWDGSFREFVPLQYNPYFTGRQIPLAVQNEPDNPRQHRAFIAVRWPNQDHILYYANSLGDVETLDLNTLLDAGISFPNVWFSTLSNPGALRTLAIDPTWTPSGSPPAPPTGIWATDGTYPDQVWAGWNPDPNSTLQKLYRRDVGASSWLSANPLCFDGCFDLLTVVPGQVYEYTAMACNTWGCSDLSTDTDTGYAAGMSPPTGLAASQGTFNDRIRVSWDAVPGATGYLVFRVLYGGSMPTSQWVTTTTWDDMSALPQGSTWEYSVAACTDPSTCSASSDPAWGWMSSLIFADGFESGDTSSWSDVRY